MKDDERMKRGRKEVAIKEGRGRERRRMRGGNTKDE